MHFVFFVAHISSKLFTYTAATRPLIKILDGITYGDVILKTAELPRNDVGKVSGAQPVPLPGPLPEHLDPEEWRELEGYEKPNLAWMHFMPFLGSRGYDLLISWLPPEGGRPPARDPAGSLSPPKDLFNPQSNETFVSPVARALDQVRTWMNMVRLTADFALQSLIYDIAEYPETSVR